MIVRSHNHLPISHQRNNKNSRGKRGRGDGKGERERDDKLRIQGVEIMRSSPESIGHLSIVKVWLPWSCSCTCNSSFLLFMFIIQKSHLLSFPHPSPLTSHRSPLPLLIPPSPHPWFSPPHLSFYIPFVQTPFS